ncbi:MAG: type II toxin-antitoxin system HigB family toxin [Acidobacteria bacterium]|nr:MAG: type II toxin-antitoxin system HigB family toxin [Acidobacteriota bacterium]
MLVIGRKIISLFVGQYADSQSSLAAWLAVVERADWKNIVDARQTYPHADAVGTCTVFNIKGNHYRLIVRIDYRAQTTYIKKVLTHAEYDKEKWKKDCGG